MHTVNVINCQNVQKNWTKGGVDNLITKLRSTGDIARKQVVSDLGRHAPMKLSLKLQIWNIISSAINQWPKRHFEYQL